MGEGMAMVVVREGMYICDLKIVSASASQAVGEIQNLGPSGRVRVGDLAIDEARFGTAAP